MGAFGFDIVSGFTVLGVSSFGGALGLRVREPEERDGAEKEEERSFMVGLGCG
ncbi:hypothetical protein ASNO1_48800 [Corallococcus caeni]|uniref:Uncharacterized protein n=1 Tax=Corallococcus caeni TaxID=3082388 RepID=A0ABQ6QX46_9BACT|nr:hypothetical protein ASNO1_48800 [Corallococcus sp. NO1]